MKKILFAITGLFMACLIFAQSPQAFKYQAVVRDNAGLILSNQDVNFKIDILKGTIDGSAVYSETHASTTNTVGVVNLEIGNGTTTDDFSAIMWDTDSHFIKVWVNGSEMGTSQLLSVPYALHAGTAGHANTFDVLLHKGDTPCNAETKGAMRYNDTTNLVEFCNGSNWIALSSGISVELAQLSTKPARQVTTNSAASGGIIISNGGSEIFEKGICWNMGGTPTISDEKSMNGSGSEEYTSNLYSLVSNETYYVRAYAKNAIGTAYGYQQFFTTLAEVTETKKATYISNTSFGTGGTVETGGGSPIFDRGIVYSLNPQPTEGDESVSAGSGSGSFDVVIEEVEDQTYYFRSYVYNDAGYNYGPEKAYRNHFVTEENISILPTTVKFSNFYGDSFSPVAGSTDDGKTNTQQLISKYGADAVAAYICDTLTAKGHTDWFLPAKEELNHLYINKDNIGITNVNVNYWSSTVYDYEMSWAQEFELGQQSGIDRTTNQYLICIRRKE